jgi:hypothetical protein
MVQLSGQRFRQNIHVMYTTLTLHRLGMNIVERQICYQFLFTTHIEGTLLDDIRDATQSGMAFGNDRFKEELASLTGRRL